MRRGERTPGSLVSRAQPTTINRSTGNTGKVHQEDHPTNGEQATSTTIAHGSVSLCVSLCLCLSLSVSLSDEPSHESHGKHLQTDKNYAQPTLPTAEEAQQQVALRL